MKTAVTVIQVLCGLFLIAVVLLQSGKSAGLSGAISGAVRAPHIINQSKCIKCGACMDHCRFDAIYKQ